MGTVHGVVYVACHNAPVPECGVFPMTKWNHGSTFDVMTFALGIMCGALGGWVLWMILFI
jgi:hypothetical protein